MTELKLIIENENPDIVSISEVLPKNPSRVIHKEEFNIPGYDLIPHRNVLNNTGRGSAMYIKNTISYKEIKFNDENDQYEEIITVEINLNKNDHLLCANVYRREKSSNENNDKLLKILETLSMNKNSQLVIMGDFNLRDINWNDLSCPGSNLDDFNHRFLECVRDSYLFQNITEPTRKRGRDKPSVLDLIFTNEENMIKSIDYLAPLGKSDHSILKFYVPYEDAYNAPKITVNYEKGNYKALNETIENTDWPELLRDCQDNVNEQWKVFKNIFYEAEKKFVPRKKVFVNGTKSKKLSCPLDRKSLRKIKKKNKIWSKVRKDLTSVEENMQYNRIRNQVRRLTRKAKKSMERNIAKNSKSNPKAFWRYTQSKLKSKSNIPDLLKSDCNNTNTFTENDDEKAEVLLNYFSSVFTNETNISDMPFFEEQNYEHVLDDFVITEDTIIKKLKKLKTNKSPGPDKIHPRVLHEISNSVSTPLVIIFNTSLRQKEVPLEWKQANVSAIYKKGNKTLPQNYRPVSLTCIICKVMEGIVRDKLIEHMKDNNLFSPKQFGFISGRSTVLQLLHVLNIWTEILDQGGCLDVVYCDFMKAFDKVPHRRLIYKIDKYGIKGNILGWIDSFLSNRSQKVVINNSKSSTAPVTSGIPQGSVLGPLLFVIYINDLPGVVDDKSYVFLFADDTKLFRQIQSSNDVLILQNDIKNLIEWSNKWLLKFHPDKCLYMGIGYNNDNTIKDKYSQPRISRPRISRFYGYLELFLRSRFFPV